MEDPTQSVEAAKEAAIAVQEVAKTTREGISALEGLGRFWAKVVGEPLAELGGLCADKVRYRRIENQIKFKSRVEMLMQESGIHEVGAVPMKLALPILHNSTMEDDDYLRELWARLLINAMNISGKFDMNHAFVGMLKEMGYLEAKCLKEIYLAQQAMGKGVYTQLLPERAEPDFTKDKDFKTDDIVLPTQEVQLALWNLARLNCIKSALFWKPNEKEMGFVYLLPLGRAFVEACELGQKEPPTISGSR